VLGAGVYQVPLIKKVKEMGFRVVVISINGDYPGIKIADIFVELDIRDKHAILKVAKMYEISAILTTGSDVSIPTIGYINDKLGLKGIGYKSAKKSTNKVLMKQCFLEGNIATAVFKKVKTMSELIVAAKDIGFPVMVKAIDSSGSKGVTKINSVSCAKDAFDVAIAASNKTELIVEKYLNGYEIGAQAIVVGNVVVDVLIHSDEVTPPPVSTPIGHSMPIDIDKDLLVKVKKLVVRAVNSLGIENTISNIDIMIVDGDPYIIEVGARMGATCLPENISIFVGFNAYEFLIKLSLDGKPKLPKKYAHQANASILLKSEKTGVVKSIEIDNSVFNNKNLVDFSLDINIGDSVKKFKIGPDRIGHIITTGSSKIKAIDLVHRIERSIKVGVCE
jgi:biotin carboxylase